MANESQAENRIRTRTHIMIVHSEAPKVKALTEVLCANGEIRITQCESLHQLVESSIHSRADGFVVEVGSVDDLSLLSRFAERQNTVPLIAMVTDGSEVAIVDQYGSGEGLPFFWDYKGAGAGNHKIEITVVEDKNPSSFYTSFITRQFWLQCRLYWFLLFIKHLAY